VAKRELILGGGCFWCMEAVFQRLKGVEDVISGYANGNIPNPTYKDICTGTSGYAEVVKIKYNDEVISTKELLEIFFALHDPTTVDRQGGDIGTQYRSTILFETIEDEELAYSVIDDMQKDFDEDIVTIVEELDRFYDAEDYHQNYYQNNMMQGYCMAVISPKMGKLEDKFRDYVEG